MGTEMKVEIITRKTIKPSSPTSKNNRTLKLSIIDKSFSTYSPMIFFYTSNTNTPFSFELQERSKSLQKSLSKTLVHFFPLAGRLQNNVSIDCNDEGAYFVEAHIKCNLLDFLNQPNSKLLNHLLPINDPQISKLPTNNVVLLLQLNLFSCGGIAIASSSSHKILDASSFFSFFNIWSTISRENGDKVVPPQFIGASLLPPKDNNFPIKRTVAPKGPNFSSKRFFFYASKLASLKAKISSTTTTNQHLVNPSKLASLKAILFKCAVASSHSSRRPVVLTQFVNLRTRMLPPMPPNSIGNLIWSFPVFFEEMSVELHEIVAKMRKGLVNFCNEKAPRFKGEDGFSLVCESLREENKLLEMGIDTYSFTGTRNVPIDEIDFGWGKPIWATCPLFYKNKFVLSDTKCGSGIEVWVTLEEQHMAMFERHEELLEYASINPSAAITHCRM
ncbi:hypothetical protein UlMin_006401 [Ulmus minor]